MLVSECYGATWLSRLTVRVLEENLTVDTSRTDERRVKSVDLVCSHDHLDVSTVIESIQLVQKLQHGTLDFSFASRGRIITLGTNSIDFVDEDN